MIYFLLLNSSGILSKLLLFVLIINYIYFNLSVKNYIRNEKFIIKFVVLIIRNNGRLKRIPRSTCFEFLELVSKLNQKTFQLINRKKYVPFI